MEIQSIEGHLYKSWAVYQSSAYQVSRIEIYRWGQGSTTAPPTGAWLSDYRPSHGSRDDLGVG